MKNWKIKHFAADTGNNFTSEIIRNILLNNRGFINQDEIGFFLNPPNPLTIKAKDVGINETALNQAIARIIQAIKNQESIVVYADYDADGITAGAIMWEALYELGAKVMPYIPHRVEEGYGLSIKGIDSIIKLHHPNLIITVDHGITAWEKVKYAQDNNIDVIITDHHVIPENLPKCITVHTTQLSGAGISWFVANQLLHHSHLEIQPFDQELLALAAIGTIADMVPLIGVNRSIAKFGLTAINNTKRIGLLELMKDAGLIPGEINPYSISHILAPRLNAMGRIVHAMDALRLICTKNSGKAKELAQILGLTNKERQQLTIDTTLHAKDLLKNKTLQKLIFISDTTYNPGVIGLVAGKLTEEYFRPSVVVSIGEEFSKASARSIPGFNIVEIIKQMGDLLVDVGGHPMAAGFTIYTSKLSELEIKLISQAEKMISDEMLIGSLFIDMEIPFTSIDDRLWEIIIGFRPFGFGNMEPVFVSRNVKIIESRLVGNDRKHLKLRVSQNNGNSNSSIYDAIAFGMGKDIANLKSGQVVDVAYTIDMNTWNGKETIQLKVKDIQSTR
jgi:single-stranded-DNA-specific exonuclease